MCTLAVWVRQFSDASLVVAANRDEKLDRPSSPPMIWPGSPRIVAPRDEVSGGSWWAINEEGLFVGLTNRAGANLDAGRRSRGLLVMEVAATRTLDEAERHLRQIGGETYNGFHLLVSDGQEAVRAIGTGVDVRVDRLGAGLHILSERSFEAVPVSRDDTVRQLLGGMAERPLDVSGLERALATHDDDPLKSICVHWEAMHYGTRSSTVIALGASRRVLHFAPDAPCRSRFEDMSGLIGRA